MNEQAHNPPNDDSPNDRPTGDWPADSNFQRLIGYELAEWREGHATVALQMEERHRNRTGRLHGGVAVTLLDTACGYAGCYSPEGEAPRYCITLSLNTSFVAAVSGGRLSTTATVIGGGRRIFFARAEVRDENDVLIASGEGSFRYL